MRARVKPELIRWVRRNAGLSVADAARKAGTSVAIVRRWEDGAVQPTVRQLRLLANATKRPLAVFYLAEPPRGFTALRDFRRLPGPAGAQTPALRLAVRLACERRQLALELATDLGELPPPLPIQASVEEPVTDVARRIRGLLGISVQEQKGWKDSYAALNGWRHAAQQRGVLVFQARGVSVSEMRGFSVTEEPMPLIVLNTKDAPNGRVFTLLHEFCHVLLRKGGICDLKSRGRTPEEDPIEVFCNRVAAETLVPRRAFAQAPVVRDHPPRAEWQTAEVAALAMEFSVSREVVVRRLLTMGRLTRSAYRSWRQALTEEYEAAQGSRSGFASPVTSAVSGLGQSFVKLVLLSYYQDRITSRDVSEYLGVRLKHMARIEERVMGSTVMFR